MAGEDTELTCCDSEALTGYHRQGFDCDDCDAAPQELCSESAAVTHASCVACSSVSCAAAAAAAVP